MSFWTKVKSVFTGHGNEGVAKEKQPPVAYGAIGKEQKEPPVTYGTQAPAAPSFGFVSPSPIGPSPSFGAVSPPPVGYGLVENKPPQNFAGIVPEKPNHGEMKLEVYFDFDHRTLGSGGQKLVKEMAERVKAGREHVIVTGHTDYVGGDAYNQRLSEDRANAVKAELIKDGVASDKIITQGVGKADQEVKTKDRNRFNRRVTVGLSDI